MKQRFAWFGFYASAVAVGLILPVAMFCLRPGPPQDTTWPRQSGWGNDCLILTAPRLPDHDYACMEWWQDDTGRHFRDYDGTVYNLNPWLPDTAKRAAAQIVSTGWRFHRYGDHPSQFEERRAVARVLGKLQEAR